MLSTREPNQAAGVLRLPGIALFSLVSFLAVVLTARAELIDPSAFRLMKAPAEQSTHKPNDWLLSDTNRPVPDVFYRSAFTKWKHYADEGVEFDYPDDPALTLELVDSQSKKRVPVAGSPVRTETYNAQKVYRIQADGITWAVLVWSEDEWLEDGICLCGAIALRSYVIHEGALYACSFLENGTLKQFQCLGDKSRLILFESTHLPMAQGDYVRMGRSLRVKKPIQRTEADLKAETFRRYEFSGKIGWLRPGMTVNEIASLLGPPAARRSDAWIYKEADDEWATIWQLPVKSGKLQLLPDGFVKGREVPPKEGTLRWFEQKVGSAKDVDDNIPRKTPQGGWQRKFFEAFVRDAAQSATNKWDSWCQCAQSLHGKGFADPRILPIVKARFLEPIPQHHARWMLDLYDNAGSQELFKQRLNLTVQAADKAVKEAGSGKPARWSLPDAWSDAHNLLSGIPHLERNLQLPKLLEHPHPSIRGDAFFCLDAMPEPQRTAYARAGLDDLDSQVRAWAANTISKGAGSTEDLPRLRQLLANDKDYYVQEYVKEAIARLEQKPRAGE